jgi:TctA family transporter
MGTAMPKFVIVLLGCLLGVVAGLVVAVPILIVLSAADVTTFKEDLPLHGWLPFVATVYGCALFGGIMGAILGWWRHNSSKGNRIIE